jgi:hypothetical protein
LLLFGFEEEDNLVYIPPSPASSVRAMLLLADQTRGGDWFTVASSLDVGEARALDETYGDDGISFLLNRNIAVDEHSSLDV